MENEQLLRGQAIVTANPDVAEAAREEFPGHPVLLMGSDFHTTAELVEGWNALTYRATAVTMLEVPEGLVGPVKRCVDYCRWSLNTTAKKGPHWIRNLLTNLPFLASCPSALTIAGKLEGVPAFIVGPGPSLDEAMPHLDVMRRKGVVFAVNAASRALDGKQHIDVCIESHDLRAKMPARGDVLRAFALTCHPDMFREPGGGFLPFYVGEVSEPLERLIGLPKLVTSGTVSSSAVSLALLAGCDPIVLVGHDMGYPGGKVYADATGLHDRVVADQGVGSYEWGEVSASLPRPGNPLPKDNPLFSVPSNSGGEVQTIEPMLGGRDWLQHVAALDGSDRRWINTSRDGVAFAGWPYLPLENLLLELPDSKMHLTFNRVVSAKRLDKWLSELVIPEHPWIQQLGAPDYAAVLSEWRDGEHTDGDALVRAALRVKAEEATRLATETLGVLVAEARRTLRHRVKNYGLTDAITDLLREPHG